MDSGDAKLLVILLAGKVTAETKPTPTSNVLSVVRKTQKFQLLSAAFINLFSPRHTISFNNCFHGNLLSAFDPLPSQPPRKFTVSVATHSTCLSQIVSPVPTTPYTTSKPHVGWLSSVCLTTTQTTQEFTHKIHL
jgi:hypothetical protein